jgi:hypothetical protein
VKVMPPPLARPPLLVAAGGRKSHCQLHSRPALGYLRSSAAGSSPHPAPPSRSLGCSSCARSTCCASSASIVAGSRGTHLLADVPTCFFVHLRVSRGAILRVDT